MLGYYIGAGASARSLPVAKYMPCRLQELANKTAAFAECSDNLNGRVAEIAGDLRWLADSSQERTSVDALAHNCHLRADDEQMARLKKALAVFFLLEQAQRPVDPRYRDFLSYLGQLDERRNVAMPTDVRVISWNYDMQFEKAYAEFLHPDDYPRVAIALQIVPGLGDSAYCSECFSIVKLNGTASMVLEKTKPHPVIEQMAKDEDRVREKKVLAREYKTLSNVRFQRYPASRLALTTMTRVSLPISTSLGKTMSWRNHALSGIASVETLVVIGYSFPLVNRDVDHEILTRLLRPEKLYVQAGRDGPAVKERLAGLGVNAERVSLVEDVGQFYIPHPYSPSERKLPDHYNEPLG